MAGDRAGFIGPGDPEGIQVRKILVMMDYLKPASSTGFADGEWDLIVLHHPPREEPEIPCYVIHSNWDIVTGGACDALADCLGITPEGPLDMTTGLGRIGRIRTGAVPLSRFVRDTMIKLNTTDVRVVNFHPDITITRVGLVSGFGLEPGLIRKAMEQGVDLYLSGDLTHRGAILAKNQGIVLVDAPHHTTEVPGLFRLGEWLKTPGVEVRVLDRGVPWKVCSLNRGF